MSAPTYHVVLDVDCTTPPATVDHEKDPYVNVKHRLYRTSSFYKDFRQPEPEPTSTGEKCKEHLRVMCSCSTDRTKKFMQKMFPFIRIYRKYKWKSDLPSDIIAGCTVGIMQLPQGMAYAMLADLPPVVGLYMSFFPVLIYFFFGTSKHISMGTVAVASLMTGSVVARLGPASASVPSTALHDSLVALNSTDILNSNGSITAATVPPDFVVDSLAIDAQKIALATALCFLTGVVQVIFGVCRLGFVTTYMSDPLVSGFTTGAAVHVFTSQVKYVFGLKIPRFGNLFQIVFTYKAIFENIVDTNLVTLLTSAICIVILYLVKVQINQRFKDKLKVPLPIELVVVIAGTLCSHFFNFRENYNMKVVGKVPAGLPTPTVPDLSGTREFFSDAVILAVVAFAQSVSLASLMAKKHMYSIDANQELVAYGFGNIFGSFFSCYPFAASVSRSSVQESAGGKSQITSMFSASLVLVVIIVIGPLFESLPNCVLSSIIMVALRSMFLQIFELKKLWKISGYDCMIWIVTFTCVVLLYVDLGLWVGLIFSFFTVVLRTQKTKANSLEKIASVDVFADGKKYLKTRGYPGVRVVGFNSPLYYANGDIFVRQVYEISGLKPERARKEIKRFGSIAEFRRNSSRLNSVVKVPNMSTTGNDPIKANGNDKIQNGMEKQPYIDHMATPIHHLVIDFSTISFIDTVGCKVLNQLVEEYKTIAVKVFIAGVKDDVWAVLKTTGFVDKFDANIYLSVHDAVIAATVEGDDLGDEEQEGTSCTSDDDDDSHVEDKLLPTLWR